MCCAGSCVAQVGSLPSFSPPLQVYQKECLREELHEEQWEWEEASGTFDFCLVLLCNHVLLLLLFLWICTFIFLCLRPVYVYSYLPSSNSTVSKGMKDVLVQHNRNIFHILCFKAKGMLGETLDWFFIPHYMLCVTSPLYFLFQVPDILRDTQHSLWFQFRVFTQSAQNTQQTDACFQWLDEDQIGIGSFCWSVTGFCSRISEGHYTYDSLHALNQLIICN